MSIGEAPWNSSKSIECEDAVSEKDTIAGHIIESSLYGAGGLNKFEP